MSFMKRRTGEGSSAAVLSGIAGYEPCAHPGCVRRNAATCEYVDRRGRPCGYAWCPEHQVVFDNRAYCRRHGGIMRAISGNTLEDVEPPDLDNRALSLCEWVSNDLDHDMRALLEELRNGADGFQVHAQPLHLVFVRTPYSRAWAHIWTLSNHLGTVRKVGIEVNEADDSMVLASVDGNPVAKEVPPWISDRGTPISEAAVQKRRDDFRVKLVGAVVWAAKNAERSWAK
jgi:hypothetical protein